MDNSTLSKVQVFDDINKIYDNIEKAEDLSEWENELTPYEFDVIIGIRTTQLANSSPPFVSIKEFDIKNNMSLYHVAKKELLENKLPYILKRMFPNGKCKYIRVADLNMECITNRYLHE